MGARAEGGGGGAGLWAAGAEALDCLKDVRQRPGYQPRFLPTRAKARERDSRRAPSTRPTHQAHWTMDSAHGFGDDTMTRIRPYNRPRRGRRTRPTARGSVCMGPDPADSGTAGVAFEGRGEAWGGWGQSLGFSPCRLRRSRGCCACVVRQGVARADRHSNGTAWGESVPQPQQESQDATRRNKTQSATRRNKTQQAEASSNKPQLTRVPRGHVRHDGAYG